jgi:hypothetical protein
MHLSRWKQIVLGLLGTILLGAVGSGFWELGLKPTFQWLGRMLLTAVTLGSNTVRDDIYKEAAKGLHETSSLQLYSLVILSLFFMCSYGLGIASGGRSSRKFRKDLDELDDQAKLTVLEKKLASLKHQIYTAQLLVFGIILLFTTSQLINYLKVNQANAACTFFAQSMAICRPYLNDQQAKIFESRFASMDSRADFVAIVADLGRLAASNQRKLPDFTPW